MLNWPKFFIKQHYKWKPVFPAIIWVLCLKKQINTLTVDRQKNMFCFLFYSSFIIFHGDGFSKWQAVFISVQLFIDLCNISNSLPKWKKKKTRMKFSYDSTQRNLHVGQGFLLFKDKGIFETPLKNI